MKVSNNEYNNGIVIIVLFTEKPFSGVFNKV